MRIAAFPCALSALAIGIAWAEAPVSTNGVVSFKDAAKIKSWDAWSDHVKKGKPVSTLAKERPCVTWKALNRLNPGMKELGRLPVRTSPLISASSWSVGCETMDRDYAEWDSFKELLPLLGVKHARFFSGWAKTEQEKGKYDFAWLDRQLRECTAMGIRPWVCLSYGNPVWGSDFRLGMRVKQVTGSPEAFEAWLRYCRACVERYRDIVDEWEIWNEPFNQGHEYAEMVYRTAKAIHEVQPNAKCFVTAISWNQDPAKNDYAIVAEKLKKENALDLVTHWIYHPYNPNPDTSYAFAERLREFVKGYSPRYDVMQGEVGCPSQLEFAHAMNQVEWTEYSQAKWDLRRTIGDFSRNIPCNVFTMIDLQYTFMLQSFGLVRSNTLKEFVYRRPSFYAMQHVFSLLDCDAKPVKMDLEAPFTMEYWWDARNVQPRRLTCSRVERKGAPMWFYWFAQARPGDQLGFDRITLPVWGRFEHPVWADMITGRIFEIPAGSFRFDGSRTVFTNLPMWDSPVLIAERSSVLPEAVAAKPKIIFDTDMYTDFDDVGSLAVLHSLADAGECEILGTVVSTRKSPSTAMVELLNRFYGRPELPIAAPRGIGLGPDTDPGATKNPTYRLYVQIAAEHPELRLRTGDDVPDANEVYRKLLASAPDKSVTIVTTGFTTNLRRLLETKADAISPLDGRALVAKKVKAWYAMATKYPEGFEYNSGADGASSKICFRDWPTPIYFLDFVYGVDVKCGVPAAAIADPSNIVGDIFRRALKAYHEEKNGHPSWDEVTVLAAVRGWERYFGLTHGRCDIVDDKGANRWTPDPAGNHHVLTVKTPKAEVGKIVDELIARGPRKSR